MNKISIVTVVLNDLEGLTRTYKSVISQKADLEYIIVDGGSEDPLIKFLDSIDNEGVLVKTYLEPGIYRAMNYAMKWVTGDYVLFLNAGDTFVDGEVCVDFQAQEFNQDVIYGDSINVGSFTGIANANPLYMMRYKLPFCHQAVFTKSDILKSSGYSLDYKFLSDFEFYRRHYYSNGKKTFFHWRRLVANYDTDGVSNRPSNLNKLRLERKRITGRWNYTIHNIFDVIYRLVKNLISCRHE